MIKVYQQLHGNLVLQYQLWTLSWNMQLTERTCGRNSNDEVDDNNKEMWRWNKWDGRTTALQVYFWLMSLWCKVWWTVQEGEKSNISKTLLTQRVAKGLFIKSRTVCNQIQEGSVVLSMSQNSSTYLQTLTIVVTCLDIYLAFCIYNLTNPLSSLQ